MAVAFGHGGHGGQLFGLGLLFGFGGGDGVNGCGFGGRFDDCGRMGCGDGLGQHIGHGRGLHLGGRCGLGGFAHWCCLGLQVFGVGDACGCQVLGARVFGAVVFGHGGHLGALLFAENVGPVIQGAGLCGFAACTVETKFAAGFGMDDLPFVARCC